MCFGHWVARVFIDHTMMRLRAMVRSGLDLEPCSRRRRLEINCRADHSMQIRFDLVLGRSIFDSGKVPTTKSNSLNISHSSTVHNPGTVVEST